MPLRPTQAYAEQELVPSAARTANGDSGIYSNYGDASTLRVQLEVTGFSGTGPTLDVVLEDSVDGVNWNPIATFSQKTGAAREILDVTVPFADRIRVRWTLGGTAPSFTFAVVCASQSPAVA
jgi:hypothetical protein